MARRVRLAALGALCALLAVGAALVLVADDRPLEAPGAPLSGPLAAPSASTPPSQLVDAPAEALDPTPNVAPTLTVAGDDPVAPAAAPTPQPASSTPPPRTAGGETRGRVVDRKGNPIGGAELMPARLARKTLRGLDKRLRRAQRRARKLATQRTRDAKPWRAVSGSDGSFVLPAVPHSGLLQVKAAGFLPRQVPLDRPKRRLTIVLRRSRRHLGTVVAAETMSPLHLARVVAQATNFRKVVRTDPMGRFTVHPPADETLWLLVSAKHRVAKVWREQDHPTILLERGRSVRGQLFRDTDQGELPAGLCPIFVLGATQKGSPPQKLRAKADGSFHLKGGIDPKEEFTVYAFDHRYAMPLTLTWHPAGRDGLRLLLAERGGVVLTNGPQDGALRPVPAAGIPGLDPNPWTLTRAARGRGSVRWSRLAAGQYQLMHDGVRVGLTFKVEPGQTTYIRWKDRGSQPASKRSQKKAKTPTANAAGDAPEPARVQRVRVVDGAGRPLIGAAVVARQRDATVEAKTGEGGRASLDLGAGVWTVTASKAGAFLEHAKSTRGRTGEVITLRLVPPATLRGRLQPPGVASLKLTDRAGKVAATGRADAAGTFALGELAPGAYRLEIERGGQTSTVDVDVPGPELLVRLN